MNESKRKRQHLEQLKEEENPNNSIIGVNREWPFNWGEDQNSSNNVSNGNELREMKLQMAALQAKNQMLEEKLENHELKARLQALTEGSSLTKVKEENGTIWAELKEAEVNAQMAKSQLELTIKEMQRWEKYANQMAMKNAEQQKEKTALASDLDKMAKKMASIEEKYKKEIAVLKARNVEIRKGMAIKRKRSTGKINHVPLTKDKKVINPLGNVWNSTKTKAKICPDGLKASNKSEDKWHDLFAEQEFDISVEHCRKDRFRGTILYYFEVTRTTSTRSFYIGLSNDNIPDSKYIYSSPNCYAIRDGDDHCWRIGNKQHFEWPNGATKPKWNGPGDVMGCGLLLDSENKLFIFFTVNGLLMGNKIPINPKVDLFFPCARIFGKVSVEANFGSDLVRKPYKYNIEKCPGLVFEGK